MASARRAPNFSTRTPGGHERPGSRDGEKEEIWKPMLDSISSGKRLPEKSLLVLGAAADRRQRGTS
jgi:dynein light intermediate chain 1